MVPQSQREPTAEAPESGLFQKLEVKVKRYFRREVSAGADTHRYSLFVSWDHIVSYFSFKTVQSRADMKQKEQGTSCLTCDDAFCE